MSSEQLRASISSLPVEIIHHILNYLDTQTTFLSLNKVCKKLKTITETYHQYKLNFCLISKSNFYLISHLIHCENIISLTIFDGYKTRGQMQYFFQLFDLNQFIQLRALNLLEISRQDINEILKSKTIFSLHSLKIQLRELFCLQHEVSVTLASLIEKSNLNALDLNFWFCPRRNIIWPNACILQYLRIHTCTFEGYITILHKTPGLRTFILNDIDFSARYERLPKSPVNETFQNLKSLIFESCHTYMYQLEYFLSFTPSLIYLKIISDTDLLDGHRWEQYIQMNLLLLQKFEFFFLFHSFKSLTDNDLKLFIKPYQTSFWLQTKQWFVTCEYIKSLMETRLYSIPICKTNYNYHFDSDKIVYSTSMGEIGMNDVSTMRLNWSKMMDDATEEVNHFPNDRLFCKLTDLTLDIDHYWPFDSLPVLTKLIDLSYLKELTLNVTVDDDFISNAVENITTLLEQTYNIHSLSITYFLIDHDYDISMEIFCSMIPNNVKYLQIKLLNYDHQRIFNDMKIILQKLEHLWSITFQFDPFHSIQFDNIIAWLKYEREDSTHVQNGHYLHIWLNQSKYDILEIATNHH